MRHLSRAPPRRPDAGSPIHELSIESGGVSSDLAKPPQRPSSVGYLATLAVIIAAVAGLTYGFLLGRGDRPEDQAALTSTPGSLPSTTVLAEPEVLPEGRVGFVRAIPGHQIFAGVTEYLDFNHYRAIAVDASGLVWTGGPSGVMRLDPSTGTFTPLTSTDGSGPLDVREIAVAADGSVWAATDLGLSHWVDGEWDHDSRLPKSRVLVTDISALQLASDGRVFVAAHVFGEFSETSEIYWGEAPFLGDVASLTMPGWVSDLAAGPEGDMWAINEGGGIWRFADDWTRQAVKGPFGDNLEVGTDGVLWIAYGEHLWRWDGREERADEVEWPTGPADTDQSEDGEEAAVWIHELAAGPDGSMWALTNRWDSTSERESTELVELDQTETSAHPLPPLADGGSYQQLAVAADGSVWLAAEHVVVRYSDGITTEFRVEDSPVIDGPSDLAVGSDGELWMATDAHLTRWDQDEQEIVGGPDFGLPEGSEPNRFYGPGWGPWPSPRWVEAGTDGSLWAGQGCRAARSTGDGWVTLPPLPSESADCWDESIRLAPDGSVWLAPNCCSVEGEPLFHWEGEAWEVFAVESRLHSFTVADDGTIWGTGDSSPSLTRFEGGDWVPVIEGFWLHHVIASSDGTIWALEPEGPLTAFIWRYDGATWERTQVDAHVSNIYRAPDGEVWALTHRADGRSSLLNLASGRTRWVVEASTDVMTIAPDGTVWVAGYGRLYRVDPTYGSDEFDITPVNWGIQLDDAGPGIHSVHMIVEVDLLASEQIGGVSGTLIWDETVVELCGIGFRGDRAGFLRIGDIFQTTEGCGIEPSAMQNAFDEFGLPQNACLSIDVNNAQPHSHCEPLPLNGVVEGDGP